MKHWLFKSEPSDFSLQDLKDAPDQTECWDGVRNYQARNLMRDEMKLGDRALFYHSNLNPSVVGTVTVVRESYPITPVGTRAATTSIPKALPKTRAGLWWM